MQRFSSFKYKFILFILLFFIYGITYGQTRFEYPIDLKKDTLYIPLLDLQSIPEHTPSNATQRKDFDKVLRKNKQLAKANKKIIAIIEKNYPFDFKAITLDELDSLSKDKYVLESFSQLTKKMAYYYKDNFELLEELMDESENRPHQFKDVFLYYYITTTSSDKEYIMVDFGKKNIPQALRYFCKSVEQFYLNR